ncbi:ribonuclease kappa-A [Silurus asotus]|uniref:Ribonuclease kappa-A n=1 Tax=Silurus asotus TaxID=30991 RepID=A0AAD5A4R5_SILAS|nr:ribonuclease kappa-A [Silurus asotus]
MAMAQHMPHIKYLFTPLIQDVYAVYNNVGYNCFIAAGIYVVIGLVSFVQVRLNKRNDYLVR